MPGRRPATPRGGAPQPIHAAEPVPGAPLLAMGSRSHLDPDTTAYLELKASREREEGREA